MWLVLFLNLLHSTDPYENTRHVGLVAQSTPWDCGSAAAATLFTLAGQSTEPRLMVEKEEVGTSLVTLSHYFEVRGWEVMGYNLSWEHILHFFQHSPHRPLLAHRSLEEGHYVVLLGIVQDFLVVADPSSGIKAVSVEDFLDDFSGFTLHFPSLPALSAVEKILSSVDERLRLLKQSGDF